MTRILQLTGKMFLSILLSLSLFPSAALAENATSVTENTSENMVQYEDASTKDASLVDGQTAPGYPAVRMYSEESEFSGSSAASLVHALATSTYEVKFFDWNNAQIGLTQYVDEGDAAVEPSYPYRQGYAFIGWDKPSSNVTSNLDIYAQYDELMTFAVTINYVFSDNSLARQPTVFAVEEGGLLNKTIESPAIAGYAPDQQNVMIDLVNIQKDESYTVVYTAASNTPYKIERYQQNLMLTNLSNPRDPLNYTIVATESMMGATGSFVVASNLAYVGFSLSAPLPSMQVSADGTSTLRVYYDRNQYAVYFDSAGGSYVAPISCLFGATVTAPANPTRAGYVFDGWGAAVPSIMPANDITLTAKWKTSGTASYTLVYYLENAGSTGYDYVGTASSSAVAGSTPLVPVFIPGTIPFPISTSHITYNSIKTLAELPAVVGGDGTTVVNVYYDRKSYAINFKFNANKYKVVVGGTTYTTSPYVLTAKYGANIDAKWPEAPILKSGSGKDFFVGWSGDSISYMSKQYFLDDAMINNTPFTAEWSDETRTVTVYNNFRNLTGGGYTASYTQQVTCDKGCTKVNASTFQGFTVQQSTGTVQSNNTVNFYYDRNQYQITYYNGGVIDRSTTAYYQADVGGPTFSAAPSIRPASVPSGYVFAGWYTTPQGYDNSKFNFTGATMPAYNLVLYARWDKPTYTATFDADNGSPVFAQTAVAFNTLTEPVAPTKPGYTFGGWYLSGSSQKYTFSFPVTSNLYLKAQWIPVRTVSYDVVYMKSGVEYQRQTFGGKTAGESVTASAIALSGYVPDALSKSIVLQASGNQIVFNYTPLSSVGYTVRYVDLLGLDLKPAKQATTSQASVIENYIDVSGYSPNHYQQTLIVGPNEADNVITFVYTKNANASYIVRSMFENIDGSYSQSDVTKYAPAGSRAIEAPQSVAGFTFKPTLSVNNRVVASDNSTIIRMVYGRNHVSISFAAGDHGTLSGTTVFTGIPYGMTFGAAVILPTPVADPGYQFDSWSPGLPAASATITGDMTYTATFVKDDSKWAKVSFVGNGSTSGAMPVSSEMLIGSTYTLPANGFARTNFNFANWDTLSSGLGTSYANQETVTVTGNMVLYAQWVERDQFAVVYLGGGGLGTLTDTTVYHAGDTVHVLENTFVNPGYKFVGWKDAGGAEYTFGGSFSINATTYLTAQWEYDSSQWVDVIYDKNSPDATGLMPADTTVVNQPYVIDANAYNRTNYNFVGWNTAAGGMGTPYVEGQTITPSASGALTLYAQWREGTKYTITYVANNQTADQRQATGYQGSETTVLPLTTFTYANHDCFRWATNPDGTGDVYFAGNAIPLTQNLTLYAFWLSRHLYTETYKDGFSSGEITDSHYADAYGYLDITVKNNPFVRQGYSFAGWLGMNNDTAAPGTVLRGINSDLAFTAQWEPFQNFISYDLDGGTVAGANPTAYTIETPSFDLINPTKPGYTFVGWTGAGLSSPTESVTIDKGRWGNLSFTANWVKDATQWATVSFVGNGSTSGSMPASAEMLVGSSYALPANSFTRTGFTFVNWDTLPSGQGVSYIDQHTITVTENMTLYAQWVEFGKYAVVYLGNGGTGTMTDSNSYGDGSSVTVRPSEFVNPGYLFVGWKDVAGVDYAANTSFAIHANTYLSAQWEYDESQWAEIVYDANSLDATGSMSSEKMLIGESRALAANAFMRSNWAFVEWNSQPDGTGQSFSSGEVVSLNTSGPHTFYAQWVRVLHEAHFNDGFAGNSFTKTPTLNAQHEFELIIPENPYGRLGYSFMHWQSDSGAITYPGDLITGIESDLSYTAVWVKTGYSIEYNLDGGTVAGINPEMYTPEAPTFSLINPTKPGYTFTGWTGTNVPELALTVRVEKGTVGDLSFVAHWVQNVVPQPIVPDNGTSGTSQVAILGTGSQIAQTGDPWASSLSLVLGLGSLAFAVAVSLAVSRIRKRR